MRLHEVQQGQSFVLLRTGRQYTHHGRHPSKKYLVLTAPFSPVPIECKTLHIACEVELCELVEQPLNNLAVDHKHDCINRPATDKFGSYPAQDGWEDGKPRIVMVRTPWEKMGCGYSERVSDEGCAGCKWRNQ
jgi:hypothetical protein